MKNLILFLLFSGSVIAQQSEVVYENIIITPLKSSENLLIQGVKKHNEKYHMHIIKRMNHQMTCFQVF